MAKLSSIVICDGAVLSFGQWTLVGVTRTLWSDQLPFDPVFGMYVCCTDVRKPSKLAVELYDPVAAASGETGALKWRYEAAMAGAPDQTTAHRYTEISGVRITRAVDHELHVIVDGKLVDVATIEVVA